MCNAIAWKDGPWLYVLQQILKYFVIFTGGPTTTPICDVSEGMQSASTIPSTEINVNDNNANAEYLRPNSATPFESLKPTLIIEYSPSMSRPVKKVMLISTENIKTYTVNFYNADGSVIKKIVSIYGINNVKVE